MTSPAPTAMQGSNAKPSAAPRNSPRVLIVGLPRLAKMQSDALEAYGVRSTYINRAFLPRALFGDIVYQVGGPVVSKRFFATCRMLGLPLVKHWVGYDVLEASHREDVRRRNREQNITHWTVAPWLAEELASFGIRADVVPLSTIVPSPGLVLPSAPLTVLAYLPEHKFNFYGGMLVLSLARRFPGVRFLVLRCSGQGIEAPPNVQFLGFRDDMEAVYARSHVLLRMADHDGLSHMVLEALNYGRYAIWNRPFAGALAARSEDNAAALLAHFDAQLTGGRLVPNDGGRAYVAAHYARDFVAGQIKSGLQAALARAKRRNADAR